MYFYKRTKPIIGAIAKNKVQGIGIITDICTISDFPIIVQWKNGKILSYRFNDKQSRYYKPIISKATIFNILAILVVMSLYFVEEKFQYGVISIAFILFIIGSYYFIMNEDNNG